MRIALCIIVEGDKKLEMLKGAVASALPAVDGVYITANQEPHTEVKKWCEEQGYNFTYLPWSDDFAAQRNFNFSQAKGYDYILWMDSDDIILGAHKLKDVARVSQKQEFQVVFFDYWYGSEFNGKPSLETFVKQELTQKRERLIMPNTTTWKKRLHETPVPIDGEHFRYSRVPYDKEYPIAWLHLGADRDMPIEEIAAKMNRNRRLLELELNDERANGGTADPRTLLYLMKIYAEDEDPQILKKCVEMGDEYLQKSGWDMERAVCCQLMAQCMGKLGLNEDAKVFLHKAIAEYPYDPMLYLYLSRVYFNLRDFRAMKHWMQLGLNLPVEDNNSGMTNLLGLKVLSAELMTEYYINGERNLKKAWESMKMLNKINPNPQNQETENKLKELKDMDEACAHIHSFLLFLKDTHHEDMIPAVIEALPDEIATLPFATSFYNKYKEPKVWGENEVCYFANFNGPSFEKWDGNSLTKGIGGSETAVIKLSEEWAKKGYKVTVYGDPEKEIEINGVLYQPWYKFNNRDFFNIFIQWRQAYLSDKINAKKFYVDMHDIYFPETFQGKTDQIDKIFVKSKYHRELAKDIPDNKYEVISNGI